MFITYSLLRNIKLNLFFVMRWNEHRIELEKSHGMEQDLVLQKKDHDMIWKPEIYVMNMEYMKLKMGLQQLVFFFVTSDKRIHYFFGVILLAPCSFDFSLYPFDTQTCVVNFTMSRYTVAMVRMRWDPDKPVSYGSYHGGTKKQLPKYNLELHAIPRPTVLMGMMGNFSTLQLVLKLSRDMESYILSTYVPSTIFVVVSWCSFLVPPSIVPGRMVVIVTTLLSLITMYDSHKVEAPPSVNVQCLDIWLLVCIVIVFFTLLEYGLVLFLDKCEKEKQEEPIKYISVLRPQEDEERNMLRKSLRAEAHSGGTKASAICYKLKKCCFKNNKWNWPDRISIVVFPAAFILYNVVYWNVVFGLKSQDLTRHEVRV